MDPHPKKPTNDGSSRQQQPRVGNALDPQPAPLRIYLSVHKQRKSINQRVRRARRRTRRRLHPLIRQDEPAKHSPHFNVHPAQHCSSANPTAATHSHETRTSDMTTDTHTPAKPDFLATLERDGFVVVPGVIPAAACEEFQESALSWLEGFPFGFKRDDRSTWTAEHLPYSTTWVRRENMYAHTSAAACITATLSATRTLCGRSAASRASATSSPRYGALTT